VQDRARAQRYQAMLDKMRLLRGRLGAVRAAAATGDGEAVVRFVIALNEELAQDHRQFLAGLEGATQALNDLQTHLDALQKQPPPKSAAE
jgi:hypothetical protein